MSFGRPRVVVVGAGVAGLAAARDLRNQGVEVTIIDRGAVIGGRLTTRHPRPGPLSPAFDLGPQYLFGGSWSRARRTSAPIGADAPDLRQFLHELHLGGAARSHQIASIGPGGGQPAGGAPGHGTVLQTGMARIAFSLQPPPPDDTQPDPYRGRTTVLKLEPNERRWRVRALHADGTQEAILADAVVLAVPVPEALALAEASGLSLPQNTRDELRAVRYARCIAIAASFDGPSHVQPDGGVHIADSPLEWVTDNHRREVSPVGPALTGLSSESWAEEHWHQPDDAVREQLLRLLRPWADGEPRDVVVQRWAYSRPTETLAVSCLIAQQEPPLVFAGDAFAGHISSRVVAAYTSGKWGARRVLGLFAATQKRENRFKIGARPRAFLEVCVTSADEASVAAVMGADRVELCSAVEVGGVTPSPHTFLAVRRAVDRMPVYALLRPRTGGFVYSDSQFEVMKRDAEWFMANGAAGLVFGILTDDGRIDHRRCRELVELSGGNAVFNRAFDFVADPLVALEDLVSLEFARVQTSGRAATAEGGMGRIHGWVQHAGWQIDIMPAGGITPGTVGQLLRVTGANHVHGSFRSLYPDPTLTLNPAVAASMGGSAGQQFYTDAEKVHAMRHALDAFAAAPTDDE